MINEKERIIFTDYEILKSIQELYEDDFVKAAKEIEKGNNPLGYYVPIDCEKIAQAMNADKHIVFAKLYYYFNQKYSYTQDDAQQSKVYFFAHKQDIRLEEHCINYPYLCSILAIEDDKRLSEFRPFKVSIAAVIISIIALFL